jgi:hypothetical protein
MFVLEALDERGRGKWIAHTEQTASERRDPDLVVAVAQ